MFILCLISSLSLVLIWDNPILAYAEEDFTMEDEEIEEILVDEGVKEGRSTGLIATIKEAMNAIRELFEFIKLLFTEGLLGVINRTIADILNSALAAVAGTFGKLYLMTPSLITIPFVKNAWTFFFLISISLTGLSLAVTAFRVITKLGSNEQGKKGIRALLIAIAFMGVTLAFVEVSIALQAFVWDAIIGESSLGVLGNEYSSLRNIPGDMIMKIAYSNYHISMEELQYLEISEVFLNPQNGNLGGIFGLIISMSILIITGFLGLFRFFVLIIQDVTAPVYLVGGALMGDTRPQVGIANLIFRNITLQSLFTGGWVAMVFISRDESIANFFYDYIGISPILINVLLQFLILVAAYLYWMQPLIKALKDPLTLAGGEVITKFGGFMKGAGAAGETIARNMGWTSMENLSTRTQEFGGKIQNYGEDFKLGEYELDLNRYESGKQKLSNHQILESFISGSGEEISKEEHDYFIGEIPSEKISDVQQVLKNVSKEAYTVEKATGEISIKDDHYDEVVSNLSKIDFVHETNRTKNIDGIEYRQVEVPASAVGRLEEYLEKNEKIKEGDVVFDENFPNTVHIKKDQYKKALGEIKTFDFIAGLDMDGVPEQRYTINKWKNINMPEPILRAVENELSLSDKLEKNVDYIIEDKHNRIKVKLEKHEEINKRIDTIIKDKVPYWEKGNQYVVYEQGLPTLYRHPPEKGINLGKWSVKNR